jgi:hypothetical protein
MLEDKNQEGGKFFGNFIPQIEIIVIFWNQKLAQTYCHCLEFAMTSHFNYCSSSL